MPKKENDLLVEQLDRLCRICGAQWAAWLYRQHAAWQIERSTRLSRTQQTALLRMIQKQVVSAWIAGALHTGRVRSRSTAADRSLLGCQRLYCFANPGGDNILLIGADGLSSDQQELFKLAALSGRLLASEAEQRTSLEQVDEIGAQKIEQMLRQQSFLNELATALTGVHDTAEVARLVIDCLCNMFVTDRAAVFLLSADRKRLREFAGQIGVYPLVIPVKSSLAGYVIETAVPLRAGRRADFPRYFGDEAGIESVLAVPLRNRSQVMGVLMIESSMPDCFSAQDENLLIVVASQLAGMLLNVDAFEVTRKRARNLDLIHQVLTKIVGLTDEAEIAQKTVEMMAEFFGYELAVILIADASGARLINLGVGGSKADLIQRGSSYPATMGITGKVFRTGKSFLSNDAAKDEDYFTIPGWSAGSEICVPLHEGNQVIGVINLERLHQGEFSESDQVLIESMAGIVSSVIMNARRYCQVNERLGQLAAVRETALEIISDLDLETLLKRIVHRARDLVHAAGAEIGLVDESGRGIRVQTSENPWYDFTGHLIPPGKGVAGQIFLNPRPVKVTDYENWEDRLWPGTPVEFKATAGVPLLLKGQFIGTLVIMDDREERQFSDEDIETLEMIAQNVAMAIHNAQLYRELQDRIEAQRQAESRLIQSERLATAGRLTASIAHEINNPLQALHNCLYLAERQDLSNPDRQKYLTMASGELDRLIATVQRMLDLYRPGGRDRTRTDVNDLICRMVDLIEAQFAQKQIHIHLGLSPELPAVMVVASQLQQVLLNLVLNSMEAMPNGGEIYIQTSPCDSIIPPRRKQKKSGKTVGVEIIVRDTGPGVPQPARDKIFEPFVSSKEHGTGLGLSVSYGIIAAHGGALSLMADTGTGASFRIAIPQENSS